MREGNPGQDEGEEDDIAGDLLLDLIEGIRALQAASAALLGALPSEWRGRMRATLSGTADAGDGTWPPEVMSLVETAILERAATLLAAIEAPQPARHRFDLDAAFPCLLTCTGADGAPCVLHLSHVGYLDIDSRGNTVVVSTNGRDAALVSDPIPAVAAALKAYRAGPGAR